ncbi:MAG: hypothetical protein WCK37_04035 [Candidatus Falkowbacteria bacterium]
MDIKASELSKLLDVIDERGVTIAQVIKLIKKCTKEPILDLDLPKIGDELPLVFKCPKTILTPISRGNYVDMADGIEPKNFPILPGLAGKEFNLVAKIFTPHGVFGSDLPIKKMTKAGFRPATTVEMLYFIEQYPKVQRRLTMVALASVWKPKGGSHNVICAENDGVSCKLVMHWLTDIWSDKFCFLGIKNV